VNFIPVFLNLYLECVSKYGTEFQLSSKTFQTRLKIRKKQKITENKCEKRRPRTPSVKGLWNLMKN
jgi:hypothetical protein